MMSMAYGMEIMQNKDKITFFSELNDALRRVYLDGRKPSQKVLDDPTYAGYSTGHWEGDTLVVDTVALRDNTFIEGFTPHSDAMTVHERIRLERAGIAGRYHHGYRSESVDEALGDGENLSQGDRARKGTTSCGSSPAPKVWEKPSEGHGPCFGVGDRCGALCAKHAARFFGRVLSRKSVRQFSRRSADAGWTAAQRQDLHRLPQASAPLADGSTGPKAG